MEKRKYVKPSMKVVKLKKIVILLSDSGGSAPMIPDNI